MNKLIALLLMLMIPSLSHAAALPRDSTWCNAVKSSGAPGSSGFSCPAGGQPYAEAALCSRPDVILCEDFNFPQDFYYSGVFGTNDGNWFNPGLTNGLMGFSYGLAGRRILPIASTYPTTNQSYLNSSKVGGALLSGLQPDYAWAANWDPSQGTADNGSTWAYFREVGGTKYANGTPISKELYTRFQYYVTSNYTWPGDPRTPALGNYDFGSSCYPVDNKIMYLLDPAAADNPTGEADAVGLFTAPLYDGMSGARYTDALGIRFGDSDIVINGKDNYYPAFPFYINATTLPTFNEYGPYQHPNILRDPHDTPTLGNVFRFDTNRWYTIEIHSILSSAPDALDGTIEIFIDGIKTYAQSNLPVCSIGNYASGVNYTDCAGLGLLNIDAYHNGLDCTVWNGQQLIDNLVIATKPIGLPGQGVVNNIPPAKPEGLSLR